MADTATATAPETRPIVPHLKLGETREQDRIFGSRCTNCNTLYVGPRLFCPKCSSEGPFKEEICSTEGEIYVWSIIHQATPYVEAPYIAAVVDLPEGISVNTNIVGIDADPKNLKFGMKVQMYTEKVSEDKEGNSYVAYKFRPAE